MDETPRYGVSQIRHLFKAWFVGIRDGRAAAADQLAAMAAEAEKAVANGWRDGADEARLMRERAAVLREAEAAVRAVK